jgi:hypothetical protein
MQHPERFPRMSAAALSPLGRATLDADARAFRTLMAHLAANDRDRTVIMLQVENEIGISNPTRDHSPLAEAAFRAHVPYTLLKSLADHERELKPYVRDLWTAQGRRTTGTWTEVFGPGPETDDLFMAWHYAAYVERVAAAGKAAYPVPLYVNACQIRGERFKPASDPSGGPVANVLDIWMPGAPSIDIFAVDNYQDFRRHAADFRHRGNPLFMPEAANWWRDDPDSAPGKAYYSFGEQAALAFSPFGIDNRMYRDHMIGTAYAKLSGLIPLLTTRRSHGFYLEPKTKAPPPETYEFEGYRALVTYRDPGDSYGPFGLIVQSAPNEFFVSGRAVTVRLESTDRARPVTVNLSVEEGDFSAGIWKTRRFLSGDEVGEQGAASTLMLPPFSLKPVTGEEPVSTVRLHLDRIASWEPK